MQRYLKELVLKKSCHSFTRHKENYLSGPIHLQVKLRRFIKNKIKCKSEWLVGSHHFLLTFYYICWYLPSFAPHFLHPLVKSLKLTDKKLGLTSDQTVEEYFSELDTKTLDRLYRMYEMDFLLFDYKPDDFYGYVHNSIQ